jgi:hypothetical protein
MNQTAPCIRIRLRDLTDSPKPFGNIQGKTVFLRLSEIVEKHSRPTIFEISFDGIEATDASFARESVVSSAKFFHGQHSFFLTNITDRDLIDNWKYAAQAKNQPLIIWHSDMEFEVIGPEMTPSASELLSYVLQHGKVGTSQVAADLGISVPNASTRLKKLVTEGYLVRREDTADSGGVEYTYLSIKRSA